MNIDTVFSVFNGILALGFIGYALWNRFKQQAALKVLDPQQFSQAIIKIDKIAKFVEEELLEPDLSPEELDAQRKEQIEQLMPYIELVGDNVFMRFQKSAAGSTRSLNINERKLDESLFLDNLNSHPQGELIQAAIDAGIIGKSTLKLIQKNPLMLDVLMAKFAPQLEQLQNQLNALKEGATKIAGSTKTSLSFLK
ncbi:MAG: hypothetical protein V3U02_10785 [Calditrichia bacterium]